LFKKSEGPSKVVALYRDFVSIGTIMLLLNHSFNDFLRKVLFEHPKETGCRVTAWGSANRGSPGKFQNMPSTCRHFQTWLTNIVAESYNWRIGSCLHNIGGSSEHAPGLFIVFCCENSLNLFCSYFQGC